MKIVMPGFSEPTRIYSLKERNGRLTLELVETIHGTLSDIAEHLRGEDSVLMDLGEPMIIDAMERRGIRVVRGRL